MQLIQLERPHWNFFCPATGQPVYGDSGEPLAPSFRGGWCCEVPEEPLELAEELQPRWQAYLEQQEDSDDGLDVSAFLVSVDQPGWVAFEITTFGIACGPVWSTSWTVLDLTTAGDH